jgi:predicted nuclease of restriction endonuclease-like RecB superfamily
VFPSALLIARAYKEGVRPVFLGEPVQAQAEAVLRIYGEGVGRTRRELQTRVRDLEAKVDKYKVVRGLALLVERRGTFSPREGPPPSGLRERLFDETKGAAVTPEERTAILTRLAPEFGLSATELADHLWSDLEEEEVLRSVPELNPRDLLRRFNLGQCQTLLFKADQLSLTFGTSESYRVAARRIKRRGLMFTAEVSKDGENPILRVEGVVAFLRSTERYGTRLAELLPDLLSLPGWKLVAKVLYRDSAGRKRHLDFCLDEGMAEYLDVPAEDPGEPAFPPVLEGLATAAERDGFAVDRLPSPLAMGGGLEYPDLTLARDGTTIYVESVGYWSPAWVERKLERTEKAPGPYVVVAPKGLAVAAGIQHARLRIVKSKGLKLEELGPLLPRSGAVEELPRRDLAPEMLVVPDRTALVVRDVARVNRVPTAQATELLESRGFLCAGGFALRRELLPEVLARVRSALPELERVERALREWDLSSAVLPDLGFQIKWKGLESATVEEGPSRPRSLPAVR